jgi:hypothetical protein
MGKAGLARVAPVGEQPVDAVPDDMMALYEAAMVGVGGVEGFAALRVGISEEGLDVGIERRSVFFERQQIVAATAHDGIGDLDLGSHGVDRDQRPGQLQPLQEERDGDALDFASTAS